jgi:GNAT superfamily N-acetyltransferase
MTSPVATYTTRELSPDTWPDFEALFSRGNGWDHCWCMAFQRQRLVSRQGLRAERNLRNHEAKRDLVAEGGAHGVMVYDAGEPIGWCQFGPMAELAAAGPRGKAPQPDETAAWRITCFVTDKRYRRRGVAARALEAALEAIRRRGGGLVEAYPVASWGRERDGTRDEVYVQGVGPVLAAHGRFGNVSTSGTASMFEKAGFKAVGVVARTHVVMQKRV